MDTAALVNTVIPAVISVLIALAIGAVGYAIAASNENRRWKRQQRINLYREITKSHLRLTRHAKKLIDLRKEYATSYPNKESRTIDRSKHDKMVYRINEANNAASEFADQVREDRFEMVILATQAANEHFQKYLEISSDWLKAGREGNENAALAESRDKAWDAFIDQAQRDLGLKHWWNQRP